MITTILMIIAIVCFGLAAVGVAVPRLNLTAAGLFCWALAVLLP